MRIGYHGFQHKEDPANAAETTGCSHAPTATAGLPPETANASCRVVFANGPSFTMRLNYRIFMKIGQLL